jgi:hypothetical protein
MALIASGDRALTRTPVPAASGLTHAQVRARRDVDDRSRALSIQVDDGLRGTVEATDHIHLEQVAQVRVVVVLQPAQAHQRRVVDQAVDPAELRQAAPDQPRRLGADRHVRRVRDGVPAVGPDVTGNPLGTGGVNVVDHHAGAQRRGVRGARRADSASGPGDHHRLALEAYRQACRQACRLGRTGHDGSPPYNLTTLGITLTRADEGVLWGHRVLQ